MLVEEQALLGDLLSRLFRYEPEERLSAEKVLEHEWFRVRVRSALYTASIQHTSLSYRPLDKTRGLSRL